MDASGKPVNSVAGTAAPLGTAANLAGQLIQQAAAPQLVATAGPGGQITYNMIPGAAAMPAFQTVNIDGQEALVLASAAGAGGAGQAFLPGGGTLMTPSGQIIRTQGGLAGGGVIPNMGFGAAANMGGSVVNIGGNLVNLASMQQAVRPTSSGMVQGVQTLGGLQVQQLPNMATVQIPLSMNGQTAFHTVQLPIQGFAGMQQATLGNGGIVSLTPTQTNASQAQPSGTSLNIPTIAANGDDSASNSNKSPEKTDKNGNQAVANAVAAAQANNLLSAQQAQNLLFNQAINTNALANLALSQNQAGMATLIPVNAGSMLNTPGQMILTSQGMAITSFPQGAMTSSTTTTASSAASTTSAQQNSVISTVLPGANGQQMLAGQNVQGQLLPQNFLQVSSLCIQLHALLYFILERERVVYELEVLKH